MVEAQDAKTGKFCKIASVEDLGLPPSWLWSRILEPQ